MTRTTVVSMSLFLVACSMSNSTSTMQALQAPQEPQSPLHGAEPIHAAPLPPPPERPASEFLESIAAGFGRVPLPTDVVPVTAPLPAQILSDRQLSATITGHWGAAQTRDQSWIVQVPADGSATVTAVTSTAGAVSSALNIPGDQSADLHGHNVTLPLSVRPGDALVLLSGNTGGNAATPLGFASASGDVDESMAIVFVPYGVSTAYYRPPAIGRRDNPIISFLRTYGPIAEMLSDMALLPNVIDLDELYQIPGNPRPGDQNRINPNAWGAARPTIADSLAIHRRFAGDLYSDWRAAGRVPWTQHQGYGTNFAGAMSTAMLLVCSTAPVAEKAPLAHALVQRGLDDLGAVADGKFLYPLGGHCWGRKPPVVLCGHLMRIDAFADPAPFVGKRFAEDAFKASPWWFGLPTEWKSTWPFSLSAGFDGLQVANPPSTWGNPNAPNHDTFGWAFAYYSQVVPAQLGSTLACMLLGRGGFLNQNLVNVMRQHMAGPPTAAKSQMQAAGISDPAWGKDYAGPAGFASTAWRVYAPASP